jgi:predicted transcriptional regulator
MVCAMSANRKGFDPVRCVLDFAQLDDESETDEERQAVEEGKADIRAGRVLTTKELKRELGL